MSDTALTIIIIVFLLLSWPVWAPFLYGLALLVIGVLAFALGMTIVGIVKLCDWVTAKRA